MEGHQPIDAYSFDLLYSVVNFIGCLNWCIEFPTDCGIVEAVRRNPLSSRATDAEMEQVASRWLRFAGDRNGGRVRRTLARAQSRSDANSSTR